MSTKKDCRCPYCNEPLETARPVCSPCGVTVEYCPDCGKPLLKGSKECPECAGPNPAGKERKH
jgi:predicted amidophosphoribosyltransferase